MIGVDLELKSLPFFTGTEEYHEAWLGVYVTDGVKYIMENGYSWFVNDAISVIVTKGWREKEFLSVKLELLGGCRAEMTIEDGNGNVLYGQRYAFTDAKRELTLFYSNNVLMLNTEW